MRHLCTIFVYLSLSAWKVHWLAAFESQTKNLRIFGGSSDINENDPQPHIQIPEGLVDYTAIIYPVCIQDARGPTQFSPNQQTFFYSTDAETCTSPSFKIFLQILSEAVPSQHTKLVRGIAFNTTHQSNILFWRRPLKIIFHLSRLWVTGPLGQHLARVLWQIQSAKSLLQIFLFRNHGLVARVSPSTDNAMDVDMLILCANYICNIFNPIYPLQLWRHDSEFFTLISDTNPVLLVKHIPSCPTRSLSIVLADQMLMFGHTHFFVIHF